MDFKAMKDTLDEIVAMIKEAIEILKGFIAGFKKTIVLPVEDGTVEVKL